MEISTDLAKQLLSHIKYFYNKKCNQKNILVIICIILFIVVVVLIVLVFYIAFWALIKCFLLNGDTTRYYKKVLYL
mgnify:CR=1 FL=1